MHAGMATWVLMWSHACWHGDLGAGVVTWVLMLQDAAPRMAVDVQEHVQDQGIGEHHGKSDRGFYTPHDTSSKSNLGHAAAKVLQLTTC